MLVSCQFFFVVPSSSLKLCRCHPGPGPAHTAALGPCLAFQGVEVEFFGHTAHVDVFNRYCCHKLNTF